MLVEVKLQLLISYVDTQLLKRVGTEILEPKDVQNSNVSYILFPTEREKCTHIEGEGHIGILASAKCSEAAKVQCVGIFITAVDHQQLAIRNQLVALYT